MNWTVIHFPSFLKQLARLPRPIRQAIETFAFETLPNASHPSTIRGIDKLKGQRDFFKARFGSYRVGLRLDEPHKIVEVRCVYHRREMYRHFP